MTHTLTQLWARGCAFLGSEYAIMGGAMTWVSDSQLVSAISNAGGFGVIACGAMTPELLKTEIEATQQKTARPFGVNLIVMHPNLSELIDVCLEKNVSHIVFAGGMPSKDVFARIKTSKAKVSPKIIAFAPNLLLAKKMVRHQADALIIEGSEAGGHVGPVSTSVLAQEILPHIQDVPIFIAGGIGRGEAIVEYLRMGASGVQLGTRFVCAHECRAHPAFKQAFIHAKSRDAEASHSLDPRFPVIPVRALKNKGVQAFYQKQRESIEAYESGRMTLKEAQLDIEHFWAGALRRAVMDGDVETGSLMAGQSVGMVTQEQSTTEIIQTLLSEAHAYLNPPNAMDIAV